MRELCGFPDEFRWLPVDANKKQVFGHEWQKHGGYKIENVPYIRKKHFRGLALITGRQSGAAVIDMDGPGSEESFEHFIGHSFAELPDTIGLADIAGSISFLMNGGNGFPNERTSTFLASDISNCEEPITTQ